MDVEGTASARSRQLAREGERSPDEGPLPAGSGEPAARAGYASLKDVAGRAGVSFQTVSKVLNGRASVAPGTLERIRRAAEEVGYVPNALARGLVTNATKTLGIVTADPTDPMIGRFVAGAQGEARRRGLVALVADLHGSNSDVGRFIGLLSERRVDGILMAAPQAENDPGLGQLLRPRLPVVSLHRICGARVPLVGSDHGETALLAVRHLLLHGRRTIGVISGVSGRQVTRLRLEGHRRALREAGLPEQAGLAEEGDWSTAGGYLATMRLLERVPDLDALYAHNDHMAMGALRALHERRRSVPEEVAVIGCDDAPVAAYTIPSLSTVRLPFEETGRVAVQQLVRLIEGDAPLPRGSTLLPVELVARASCGCAP